MQSTINNLVQEIKALHNEHSRMSLNPIENDDTSPLGTLVSEHTDEI